MQSRLVVLALVSCGALFTTRSEAAVCPRYPAGSAIVQPVDRWSKNGVLSVNFSYSTSVDENGNTLYCFIDENGAQSPTLHLKPGDQLRMSVRNDLPPAAGKMVMEGMPEAARGGSPVSSCGDTTMTGGSTNVHFHGANVPPVCHQDEVIKTVINPGQTFEYKVDFPNDEPPGLYWYHPHIHGISEAAVQGGASGAIVIEGIEKSSPAAAGLPARVILIRDNPVPGPPDPDAPAYDLSVNYTPVAFPNYTPAVIQMKPGAKELWRVVNAAADSILDLQLLFDGVAQPLSVVALDGVAVGSQDGAHKGSTLTENHIFLAPANRAEFIVQGPPAGVKNAQLVTLGIDTGPDGDNDPPRPLANIQAGVNPAALPAIPAPDGSTVPARFAGLATAVPTAHRHLYFSEVLSDPNDPNSPTNFFITVDGQTPVLFDPNEPPAIVTTQGSVEDWTIENRTLENHEFHIHQIHFLMLAQNGVPVKNGQYLDTAQVPYWSGSGPYPSITVRLDFRGPVIGDFVYHCHILGHEDSGMMAVIRVLPAPAK